MTGAFEPPKGVFLLFLWIRQSGLLILAVALCMCGWACTGPPERPDNICDIFRERPEWYDEARESYGKWGVSIPLMMAIMHKESKFHADAKPPRTTCLWIFPGPRLSSAYGYAQALDMTWEEYQDLTDSHGADRDEFKDAIDFIGWYCHMNFVRCRIPKNDAYSLYLAYHEGPTGFKQGSHRKKPGIIKAARWVQWQTAEYEQQLRGCEEEFLRPGGWWRCLWPF